MSKKIKARSNVQYRFIKYHQKWSISIRGINIYIENQLRNDIMLPKRDQNQLMEELYHLQNCEMALGVFYGELVALYPEERYFWEEAVSDEINHARWLGKLIVLVSGMIESFSPGSYRTELLKTFAEGIYREVDRIKNGEHTKREILGLILNYERSGLELRPYEVVHSSLPEFQALVASLKPELAIHCKRLVDYASRKMQVGTGG